MRFCSIATNELVPQDIMTFFSGLYLELSLWVPLGDPQFLMKFFRVDEPSDPLCMPSMRMWFYFIPTYICAQFASFNFGSDEKMVSVRTVLRVMSSILSKEGERPQVSGFLSKSIFQSVFLFGAETWVVTPFMGRVLGGFQYQVAWQLTGWLPWRRFDGSWE